MEYFGLLVEVLLFGLGTYLYIFSRGKITIKDPKMKERVEQFRSENAGWMRILGLALAAIMLVNIVVHIQQLITAN